MIKEKDVYEFPGQAQALAIRNIPDADQSVTAEVLMERLTDYFGSNAITASVEKDIYSFKTGVFKSEQVPCVVISHSEKPKSFRKLVIAIKHANGITVLAPGMYGDSEVDRLIKKQDKRHQKYDRKQRKIDRSEDLTSAIGGVAMAGVNSLMQKSLMKKVDALSPEENNFHQSIVNAAAAVCDSFRVTA